ncbi:MAG TPA: PfkB family carbohydrate kinase [Xanthobacteraceae bacterium]|nr:PfkB family carbohydrate kinase [Xanthobacteraceae bacterium]
MTDPRVVPLPRLGWREPEAPPYEAPSPRQKIMTVQEAAAAAQRMRVSGKRIVQAHGTFDLLHVGHVRHMQAARELGDVLVVTVTADRFVNKGPGRPAFTENLRAEMLASLQYVDLVAINPEPDAVGAITAIRPDVYVKGQDYEKVEEDITGKIVAEREAVEAHGGRIHFTHEVMFSSTELINRHFNMFDPTVSRYLHGMRGNGKLAEALELIERIRDYRVVLVGDAIIDEYVYAVPMGKPPKESVIAARYQDRETFAGGVFAAANHVASFCKKVDVISCVGSNDAHEELIRGSLRPNVELHALRRPSAPTTLKRRFVDPTSMRKLFEIYLMDDGPLPDDVQGDLDRLISDVAPAANAVVVTDFGHGLIGPSAVQTLIEYSPFLAVNAQSNSANMGYNLITRYPKADYVCIDAPEARLATGDRVSPIGEVAQTIVDERVACGKIIITHGRNGCVTHERGGATHTIPAFARNVVDTVGAGDAFLAITAPLVAAGGAMEKVGFIGNVAGALKVEIVGHRKPVEKPALVKGITALLK